MPDLYSHVEFVKKVMNDTDKELNIELAKLASQGPDPMYFNVFSKDSSDYIFYADRMHDTNTRMLLVNMVKHVKAYPSVDNYSFMYGFISHYALDVSMHPYIYYNVGNYKEDKPETHIYRGLHKKFETSIDRFLMEEDGLNPRTHKLHKTHFTLNEIPESVIQLMNFVLRNTYGKKNGGVMYNIGVEKMYKNLKYMVRDRFGIKKLIYSIIDLFHKNNLFYKDISYFSYKRNYDYVNSNKTTWHHPITNEPSTKTVYDLKEDAYLFFKGLIAKVDQYLNNEDINLDDVFTNLSFNSGIDCTYHDDMKYFKKYM